MQAGYIGYSCGNELRTGSENLVDVREQESHTFIVDKEEGLVLNDRSAKRRSPLIRIGKRARRSRVIRHPVVGIQISSVPPVQRVAVVGVGAGLGDVGDLRAS